MALQTPLIYLLERPFTPLFTPHRPITQHEAEIQWIVERDAANTRTALRLILAQGAISSQLIDNVNAWIHLRALLTDLFVIDEILKGL